MRKKAFGLAIVVLFGALIRFINLSTPAELVFDEVYYVNGAQDYLKAGVEIDGAKPEFVVHPPVGKWAIAAGIKIFGDNSFGWRFSAALIATISIVIIFLVARRLFHSYLLALLAAVLTAIDGLHIVMSRTALLDIFLMFFILLGFLLLLYERHLLAAIVLGLALGTKWSALYFIAAIFIYLIVVRRKIPWNYAALIPLTYFLSWSGWFLSDKGWSRNFSSNPIMSWLHYHREMLNFHTGLTTEHSYQANPWNWLILGRPTSFFYATPKTCGQANCSQEILAMGTPMIWWSGVFALAITAGYYFYRRDRAALLILIGVAANYLPWFFFQKRTMFYFYSIAFQPFLILAIVYVVAKAFEEPGKWRSHRGYFLLWSTLVVLSFLYFMPLFVGGVLPYDSWYARMWFPSWI